MAHRQTADQYAGHTPGDRHWLALAGWIGLSGVAGAIGGVASINSPEVYRSFSQPSWAPPSWVFSPVWTTLYILMGIAAWLVWKSNPDSAEVAGARRRGLTLFVVQLVLNALWTWLFFAWRQGAAAFIEIIVLWIAIALVIREFARVRRLAAWLMLPYLLWVTYATALTSAIWRMNPADL